VLLPVTLQVIPGSGVDMFSYVVLSCFLAAFMCSIDGLAVLTTEAQDVEVNANARLLRRPDSSSLTADRQQQPDEKDDATTKDSEFADSASSPKDALKSRAGSKIVAGFELYYETACPDCIKFINQLEKYWRDDDLRPHINITLNPYGNAESIPISKVSRGYKFFNPDTTGEEWDYVHVCQHGANECFGNLVQACAIEQVEQSKYMELVFCMASNPTWGVEKASYECMSKAGIDQKPVTECVQSPRGNKLMAQYGETTGAVKDRKGTPWVTSGGVTVKDMSDFVRSACHALDNQPKSCEPFLHEKSKSGAADGDFEVLPAIKWSVQSDDVQVAIKLPEIV